MHIEHFYPVDAKTLRQTIRETKIHHQIDMGDFDIIHGTRDGQPIVICKHHNQTADQLSGIWYDDGSQA